MAKKGKKITRRRSLGDLPITTTMPAIGEAIEKNLRPDIIARLEELEERARVKRMLSENSGEYEEVNPLAAKTLPRAGASLHRSTSAPKLQGLDETKDHVQPINGVKVDEQALAAAKAAAMKRRTELKSQRAASQKTIPNLLPLNPTFIIQIQEVIMIKSWRMKAVKFLRSSGINIADSVVSSFLGQQSYKKAEKFLESNRIDANEGKVLSDEELFNKVLQVYDPGQSDTLQEQISNGHEDNIYMVPGATAEENGIKTERAPEPLPRPSLDNGSDKEDIYMVPGASAEHNGITTERAPEPPPRPSLDSATAIVGEKMKEAEEAKKASSGPEQQSHSTNTPN